VSSVAGTAEHPVKPGGFHENRQLALVAGQTRRIDFHYVPPDLQAFRGRRAAVVRITKPDGNPASGVKVAIGYFDGHYGTIPVYVGPVPDSGEILLKEITDRVPDNLWDFRGYAVRVGQDERLIGTFEFETRSALETFTFRLPPDVGDLAPDIDLVNVATGQRTRLSSLRGKLVCLDFWITWCEYCQEPMRKLDQAAADNRWKDRVKIVPLSFDEKCETVGPFLLERGWTHVEHFWAGPWKLYPLDTSAARAFVCNVIPVTFLIGPDGRILWRGHPLAKVSGMDIVDRIQETLKADRIAGKPTKPSGPSTVPKQAGETSARADQKSAAKKNL